MTASSRRQLNVPLDLALIDALKRRASEEGVTLSLLVQRLLSAAMDGWVPAPDMRAQLEDHEVRLRQLEGHPSLQMKPPAPFSPP